MNLVQLTKNGHGYQLPDGRTIPEKDLHTVFSCKLDLGGILARQEVYSRIERAFRLFVDRVNTFHCSYVIGRGHLLEGFFCSIADLPEQRVEDYKF